MTSVMTVGRLWTGRKGRYRYTTGGPDAATADGGRTRWARYTHPLPSRHTFTYGVPTIDGTVIVVLDASFPEGGRPLPDLPFCYRRWYRMNTVLRCDFGAAGSSEGGVVPRHCCHLYAVATATAPTQHHTTAAQT